MAEYNILERAYILGRNQQAITMSLFTDDIVEEFSNVARTCLKIDENRCVDSETWGMEEVPVENIIAAFRQYEELNYGANQGVILPLHEEGSAEVTGEFVIYYKDDRFDDSILRYHDKSEGDIEHVDIRDAGETYLGYRLRFWHPNYESPDIPSYTDERTWKSRQVGPSREVKSEAELTQEDTTELFRDLSEFIDAERTDQVSYDRLSHALSYASRNRSMIGSAKDLYRHR